MKFRVTLLLIFSFILLQKGDSLQAKETSSTLKNEIYMKLQNILQKEVIQSSNNLPKNVFETLIDANEALLDGEAHLELVTAIVKVAQATLAKDPSRYAIEILITSYLKNKALYLQAIEKLPEDKRKDLLRYFAIEENFYKELENENKK
jgi:hypothetical protein